MAAAQRAGQTSDRPDPRKLAARAAILRAIREFFFAGGFLEVETPVRLPAPALETHIDAEPAGDAWLRTSPELHMKRLLAAGHGKIWQMGPCFRRGERGRLHRPEYTMLEWYRANADYRDILADTRALLQALCAAGGSAPLGYQGQRIDIEGLWRVLPVRDAFLKFAGWDPVVAWDEDRFNLDLVEKVEPALPRDVPVILTDYPAPAAALARRKPGDTAVAERWELYIGGMEIANAYSELTDAVEQRARFEECAVQRRQLGKEVYPLDEAFLAALPDMPPSGGIALGVDRLVMLLTDSNDIGQVQAFSG